MAIILIETRRMREERGQFNLKYTETSRLRDIHKYSELRGRREDASPSHPPRAAWEAGVSVFLCQKEEQSPSFSTHSGYKK